MSLRKFTRARYLVGADMSMDPDSSFLSQSYQKISEVWDQTLQDRSTNRTVDPWVDESRDTSEALTGLELASAMAHLQINLTALSVKSHLEALAVSYMPTLVRDWPYHSVFALCREVLEGSALIVWLGERSLTEMERARRTLRLLAWSNYHAERAGEAGIEYRDLAAELGLSVQDTSRGAPRVDGEAFGQVRIIGSAFPDNGSRLYNLLSGYAHHGPWRLVPSAIGAMLENGIVMNRLLMVGEHYQACADSAEIVCQTIQVWDRIFSRVTERCNEVAAVAAAAGVKAAQAQVRSSAQ